MASIDGSEFLVREIDNLKANLNSLEQQKRQLEFELQQTKEQSWSGEWEMDLTTKEVHWSKEMFDILGVDRSVTPDMRLFNERLPPISRDKFNGAIRKVFLSTQDYSLEHQLQISGDKLLNVRTDLKLQFQADGRPSKLVGISNDITAIKTAQQELEKLSQIASKTSNAVVVTDVFTKIEWINEGFTRMLGYRLDEIKGEPFKKLLTNWSSPLGESAFLMRMLQQNHAINEETIVKTKRDEKLWVLVNITPILDYELNPEKFIAIISDISEQKENERALNSQKNKVEKQRRQLEKTNRELKETLDELARVKISRKSLFFSIGTAIFLVFLTEAFLDPIIDKYAYNVYLSLAVKVFIALLLRPMENFYERILLNRAIKLKNL